MVQMKSLYWIK